MNKPFPARDFTPLDPLRDWRRAVTVKAMASVISRDVTQTAEWLYGKGGADSVAKAATAPASTTGWGANLAGSRIGPYLNSLRQRSAAAELFTRAPRYDLSGVASIALPKLATDYPQPVWTAEGGPAPVLQGSFTTSTLGPARKLMALSALTGELRNASAEDAEKIIGDAMDGAAARALDASLFSAVAADGLRPAGILNGVAATAAATGGGSAAMAADLRALVTAVHAAGGGTGLVIVAAPAQAISLQLLAGNGFMTPVITAPSLATGTVVVLEAQAFATGFGADPEIEVSDHALIHLDDAPAQISVAGTPNAISAPVRSAFQADLRVLRLKLRATWLMRAPMLAFVTGATW